MKKVLQLGHPVRIAFGSKNLAYRADSQMRELGALAFVAFSIKREAGRPIKKAARQWNNWETMVHIKKSADINAVVNLSFS